MMPNKSWSTGREIVSPKRKLYDPKCWELACHFLPEDAPETEDLAAHIQDAVEDFLHAKETNPSSANRAEGRP